MPKAKAKKKAASAKQASRAKKKAEEAQPTKNTACRPDANVANTAELQGNGRMGAWSAARADHAQVRQQILPNVATEAKIRTKHVAAETTTLNELAELAELERKHDLCARSMQSLDLFHRERVERIRRMISVVQRDKDLSALRYEDPLSLKEEPAAVTVQRDLEEARYNDALGLIKEFAEEVLEAYKSASWADAAKEHVQELRSTRERRKALRGWDKE